MAIKHVDHGVVVEAIVPTRPMVCVCVCVRGVPIDRCRGYKRACDVGVAFVPGTRSGNDSPCVFDVAVYMYSERMYIFNRIVPALPRVVVFAVDVATATSLKLEQQRYSPLFPPPLYLDFRKMSLCTCV